MNKCTNVVLGDSISIFALNWESHVHVHAENVDPKSTSDAIYVCCIRVFSQDHIEGKYQKGHA